MRKEKVQGAEQYMARNHRRRIWQRVVGALACVVVFFTTYALILPAITMETPAICGFEEHSHTEECFDTADPSVRICALEEHVHTDECRKTTETTAPEETGAVAETFALETLHDTQETEPAADIVISGEGEAPDPMDGPLPEEIFVEETALADTGLTWKITVNSLNEYTLWIDGEGAMANYGSADEQPWKDDRSKISKSRSVKG